MTENKAPNNVVRIAAVADLHYGEGDRRRKRQILASAAEGCDVLVVCGDMTNFGLPEEAEQIAKDLQAVAHVPLVGVLGNHDYESGREREVRDVLEAAGMRILDGESVEIKGVGFAGVCGFGGGFGRWMLNAWGEPLIKQFVQASVDEALKLERALVKLGTATRVGLLHYSPIRQTVEGEVEEIFPWLGSSRLEEPLNRFGVAAVFHGHCHNGTPEGRTAKGIPVYNVTLDVMERIRPEQPFRMVELEVK